MNEFLVLSTLHSKPSFDLTCAVPRTGRTLKNFLNNLKSVGINSDEIDQILNVLAESKHRSTTKLSEALVFLQEITKTAPPCFSVFVDRKRKLRPYRIGFLGYDWQIGKTRIRV